MHHALHCVMRHAMHREMRHAMHRELHHASRSRVVPGDSWYVLVSTGRVFSVYLLGLLASWLTSSKLLFALDQLMLLSQVGHMHACAWLVQAPVCNLLCEAYMDCTSVSGADPSCSCNQPATAVYIEGTPMPVHTGAPSERPPRAPLAGRGSPALAAVQQPRPRRSNGWAHRRRRRPPPRHRGVTRRPPHPPPVQASQGLAVMSHVRLALCCTLGVCRCSRFGDLGRYACE